MDDDVLCLNAEACLQYIQSKFEYYKTILDHDQQACDDLIASIREEAFAPNNRDENKFGLNQKELPNQLDYFEQEAFKTYEENKTCLFQIFQKLFQLHRESAYKQILLNERQIAESFEYRPRILPNIEKLRFPTRSSSINTFSISNLVSNTDKNRLMCPATPIPSVSLPISASFSNRADIAAFQRNKESISLIKSPIESNEIDLTQLIRDTYPKNGSPSFKFSQLSRCRQEKAKQPATLSPIKPSQRTISCTNALLMGANKRFALLYNMNVTNLLHIYDLQDKETKELPWDEGAIVSLGHVDSNLFYLITSTKIFLYDLIKEQIQNQYFLYDTLYKDLFLITTDLAYQTALKCSNQIQSIVYDEYCYYLYMNKDYNQILIKCSLDSFHPEFHWNLTHKFPSIECFLGFTVTSKALITFLVRETNRHRLFFCAELQTCELLKNLPINHAIDPTRIVSMCVSNLKNSSSTIQKHSTMKYNQHIWLILDNKAHCIHCLTYEHVLKQIDLSTKTSFESISIFNEQLLLASNQFDVQIIDLDKYFSS